MSKVARSSSRHWSRAGLRLTAVAVAAAVALTACASADPNAGSSSPAAAPTSAAVPNGSSAAAPATDGSTAAAPGTDTSTDAVAPSGGSFTPAAQEAGSEILVWADATRIPAVEAYQASHPDAKLKIVTYSGNANGATDLQTQVSLFDRSGSGWPDVVFTTNVNDSIWASSGDMPFAAPVNQGVVDQTILDGFADGALSPCSVGADVYCMRNDLAQDVLWYNKKLMDSFGYTVPTTWEEYQELGAKVATEHPGYLVGTAGDPWAPEIFFWASQCTASTVSEGKAVKVDLTDPNCVRAAKLMDTMIANGSISKNTVFDADFIADSADKVLMLPGPSWYGDALFKGTLKVPAGEISAASPLKWAADDKNWTGNVGGGAWFVSSHSKNLAASGDLVTWLTTSDENQATAPGYPAYTAAATAWLANVKDGGYFAGDIGPAMIEAADLVWTGWSATQYSQESIYAETVVPAINDGKTIESILPTWQQAISDKATSLGYTVN